MNIVFTITSENKQEELQAQLQNAIGQPIHKDQFPSLPFSPPPPTPQNFVYLTLSFQHEHIRSTHTTSNHLLEHFPSCPSCRKRLLLGPNSNLFVSCILPDISPLIIYFVFFLHQFYQDGFQW